MANIKSATKRARQSTRRRTHNAGVRSAIKSHIKKLDGQPAAENSTGTSPEFSRCVSAIDKAAKRGIIHQNAANRRKSRLAGAARAKTPSTG
jgi:small subunit ribosomal protein S20